MENVLFPTLCFLWLIGLSLLFYIPLQIRKRPHFISIAICTRCGYDLSGLAQEMNCPECGADPAIRERLGTKLNARGKVIALLPCIVALLIALSLMVHGLGEALLGLFILLPMIVPVFQLIAIEDHISNRGRIVYASSATFPPAALLGWVSHALMLNPDGQAALGIFFTWIYAISATGLGLGIGWMLEWRVLGHRF